MIGCIKIQWIYAIYDDNHNEKHDSLYTRLVITHFTYKCEGLLIETDQNEGKHNAKTIIEHSII